jgi:hypothetical protein
MTPSPLISQGLARRSFRTHRHLRMRNKSRAPAEGAAAPQLYAGGNPAPQAAADGANKGLRQPYNWTVWQVGAPPNERKAGLRLVPVPFFCTHTHIGISVAFRRHRLCTWLAQSKLSCCVLSSSTECDQWWRSDIPTMSPGERQQIDGELATKHIGLGMTLGALLSGTSAARAGPGTRLQTGDTMDE